MSGPQRRARSPLLAPPEARSLPVSAGPSRLTGQYHTQGTTQAHVPPDAWVPSSAGQSRADAVSSIPSSPDDAACWTAYCQVSLSFPRDCSTELPASLHAVVDRQSPPAERQSPPAASPGSHSAGLRQLPPLPYDTNAKPYARGSWVRPFNSEQLPRRLAGDSTCVLLSPRGTTDDKRLPDIHRGTPLFHLVPRCSTSDTERGTHGVPFPGEVFHRPDRNGTVWYTTEQLARR